MLSSIDKALAGAIDVIADDVQATVKSVREQGMMRTLGDAVEDAAGMVVGGAGNALSGIMSGKKGEKAVSSHSGVSSGYADICAGNKAGSFGGGAAFPYVPNSSSGKKPQGNMSFGPGVGIRLPNGGNPPTPAGVPGIAPYAGPAGAGQFRPPAPYPPAPAPYTPAPAPSAPQVSSSPGAAQFSPNGPSPYASNAPSAGKEPLLPQEALKPRFEAIVAKEAANSRCFDCGASDHEWASVSFGIFLCITCAGHHRQLGTHISRIRSCKMDSWTERQINIFNSGGNRRLTEFFKANGVPESQRFQRYSTAAAEWYREAWIKSRTMGRPVPAPLHGVVVGPCVDDAAKAQAAKAPAAPVDLLDMGEKVEKTEKAKPAQADLLGFDDGQASAPGGDLLGLAQAPSKPASNGSDLLGFGSLDFNQVAAPAPVASAVSPATANAALLAPAAAPVQAAPAEATGPAPRNGAGTLGAGAKLIEQPQEKADDPFAMALKQWGM
mmetsp:Transcript_24356/g.57726  ORF Transcript_24356/g.57726 Transcript_24356/m.57726 type:complete len:494 (+) Transcript_24356:74-1555(+)